VLKRDNIAFAGDHPNCTLVAGDLLELDLRLLLGAVSLVFHLAAQPGVRASWEEFDIYVRRNIQATKRLLDAACGMALDRLVYASSSSVYGDAESLPTNENVAPKPVSPYGITKVATEHLAHVYWRNHGVPTVGLRYFTVYGPRQRPDMAFNKLIASALAGRPFEVYGDGNQTRDFTFVGDTVDGTLAAGCRGLPGQTYNLGGGSRRPMSEVFETLSALLGEPIDCRLRERQTGDARDTAADISKARADLGYRPSTSFDAGLAAQLQWQRERQASVNAIA
jgi:UDP-glucose 4-epimerase